MTLCAAAPCAAATKHQDRLLLSRPYPIEAAPSFPGGLFHWIDSLAGTSGGKTIPAHRAEYVRLFGEMTDDDKGYLEKFVAARAQYLEREGRGPMTDGAPVLASAMLGAFCDAASVEDALAVVDRELDPKRAAGLAEALAHFRSRYERVWNDGAIPKAFLERARSDGGKARLEALLAKIVHFYGVDPSRVPAPRLALVPVPRGYGTHAEAIGGVLLIEIRNADDLADEASVIVHENSHFLWGLVPEERKHRFSEIADDGGAAAVQSFQLFREAIPTALGQGVADHEFRPAQWTLDGPWYHRKDVDECAKRIFPTIRLAIESGWTLDDALFRRALVAAGP